MAQALSDKIIAINDTKTLVGRQLLEIITIGMYNDSKMIIREYIQNSVDAIDEAIENQRIELADAKIDIWIDGKNRNILIEDNGVGVSNKDIESALCSIGLSRKDPTRQRGFRGIGRLGGLGYCDELQFITRNSPDEDVAIITWNAKKFYEQINDKKDISNLSSVIQETVNIKYVPPNEQDSPHFFRVKLVNVPRFHRDDLMNIRELRKYLSQTAPVTYDKESFSFTDKIEGHISEVPGYRCYKININGLQILRPYADIIPIRDKRTDTIRDIELITFQGADGKVIGKGWYAKTNYLASLPFSVSMRGIRIRQGNIEVADESLLDKVYTEKRFASWHVGEIQIGYDLKLNARRDDFEPSPESERLLEQLTVLGRYLSNLCRESSKIRTEKSTIENKLTLIDSEIKYLPFFNTTDLEKKRSSILDYLNEVESLKYIVENDGDILSRVEKIRRELDNVQQSSRHLENNLLPQNCITHSHIEIIQDMCHDFLENYDRCSTAGELLFLMLKPYLKDSVEKEAATQSFEPPD